MAQNNKNSRSNRPKLPGKLPNKSPKGVQSWLLIVLLVFFGSTFIFNGTDSLEK